MKRYAVTTLMAVGLLLLLAAPAFAYNRDDAVSWAENHWNDDSNADWPGYIIKDDCTNYASGCLYEGGIARDPSGTSGGWYCYKITGKQITYNRTVAWDNANDMREYFWAKSGISQVGGYNWYGNYSLPVPLDDIPMIRGDVVSINWDKSTSDDSDHTEFGVGLGQSVAQSGGTGETFYGDMIDQTVSDRRHAIWHCLDRKTISSMEYTVFRVWHVSDSFTN
jgi:hypothetical protein